MRSVVAALRRIVEVLSLALGVAVTLPTLVLASALVRYDAVSYRGWAEHIRRALPRRASVFVAPLAPLYALTALWVGHQRGVFVSIIVIAAWFMIGLLLIEVYAVCLHREAWIAAFEPWLLPEDARPLGGSPVRVDDRRLQFLVRTQIIYGAAPVAVGLVLGLHDHLWALALATLFIAKFVAHASTDFEVCTHWNMHCRVLRIRDRPRLTWFWERITEWVLGPLYGYVPNIYRTEHLLVHHPAGSGPDDAHSPLPYNRRSFLEFASFSLKMCVALLSGAELLRDRRCRRSHRRRVVTGVVVYWLAALMLLRFGRIVGLWLVILAVHRAVTATRSQYVWHGLIDPADPRPKTTSIVWVHRAVWAELLEGPTEANRRHPPLVPTPGTDWAFYDNYHLLHHRFPRAHFTEYPNLLTRTVHEFVDDRVPVLDLSGLPTFAFNCWAGRLDALCPILLNKTGDESAAAFLDRRLRPSAERRASVAVVTESRAGRAVDIGLTRLLGVLTGGR